MVINILLVVWIASRLASLTWDLLAPADTATEVEATVDTAAPAANPDRQLITQLPSWHLMGEAARAPQPTRTATPVDAPETRLKLILRGALASNDPDNARAIIADPRGKEEQYAIGDRVPGNAELSEVHPDRVILKRNGRYETLRLPKTQKRGNTVASRTVSSRSMDTPQQRLANARQQLKQSPKKLGNLIRATPKRGEDGKTVGYVLSPGRDPELFAQVGLQPGDVAIQINEIKLDNPSNSARALKSMQGGDSVTVTVLRDDQEQVISLDWPE